MTIIPKSSPGFVWIPVICTTRGMDPVTWVHDNALRIDYLHFKDIDPAIYERGNRPAAGLYTLSVVLLACHNTCHSAARGHSFNRSHSSI